jgi:hypothetical protein
MAAGRKTGGRRAGTLNKATQEAKAACAELVDDPAYRQSLAERLRAGKLAPAVECMLWYYDKGTPTVELETQQSVTLSWQDDPLVEQLKQGRARALAANVDPSPQ